MLLDRVKVFNYRALGQWASVYSPLLGDSRGLMLMETMVAVTVFALVGTAVMMGMNTTYTTSENTEELALAENTARNQMESIFGQTYSPPGGAAYSTITPPTGFGVSVAVEDVNPILPDPDVERITVTVSRDSASILELKTIRFNE